MIVYGGVCPDSEIVCKNALQSAFSVGANLNLWSKVGAVLFTQKCLTNPKVRHDGTDANDPLFDVYADIQQQNDNTDERDGLRRRWTEGQIFAG